MFFGEVNFAWIWPLVWCKSHFSFKFSNDSFAWFWGLLVFNIISEANSVCCENPVKHDFKHSSVRICLQITLWNSVNSRNYVSSMEKFPFQTNSAFINLYRCGSRLNLSYRIKIVKLFSIKFLKCLTTSQHCDTSNGT